MLLVRRVTLVILVCKNALCEAFSVNEGLVRRSNLISVLVVVRSTSASQPFDRGAESFPSKRQWRYSDGRYTEDSENTSLIASCRAYRQGGVHRKLRITIGIVWRGTGLQRHYCQRGFLAAALDRTGQTGEFEVVTVGRQMTWWSPRHLWMKIYGRIALAYHRLGLEVDWRRYWTSIKHTEG